MSTYEDKQDGCNDEKSHCLGVEEEMGVGRGDSENKTKLTHTTDEETEKYGVRQPLCTPGIFGNDRNIISERRSLRSKLV